MGNKKDSTRLSRKIALALRHKPELFDLEIDSDGWVLLNEFSKKIGISKSEILEIVDKDEKNRYSIKGNNIRANQGHSIDKVSLRLRELSQDDIPEFLYHGTKINFLNSIKKQGLTKQKRHHVHLSDNKEDALIVANRRKGKNCLLKIDTKKLLLNYKVYVSENGVYLVEEVPVNLFEIII